MNDLKRLVGVVVIVGCAVVAASQEPPVMQPTAEHKQLEAWIGSWAGSGELKPGPFGPGGPMSWTEDCAWFEGGRFHVVCRSDGTSPMGPMKGLGIVGYNAEKKVFTHYGVDSTGWSGYAEGTRSGSTWTFRADELMGGKVIHGRYTMTLVTPTKMTFSWEMSEDGTSWVVMMDGTTEKK
ncbi:MAG TPA: DUF1579 family protein [Thermoanaerobaculales bacterium]|nr:DUF1579 family protein [Thermoanaerobaculales bacterium]